MPEGVLNNVWLDGIKSFSELGETNLSVTIEVKSTHNSGEFVFDGNMADSLQESSKGLFVDDFEILIVYCLESSSDAETLKLLKVLLELFQA